MTQPDTPVRPDESDEVRALRRLAGLAGWSVRSTTGGNHATGSLHYAPAGGPDGATDTGAVQSVGAASGNLQPYVTLTYIIKAA